MAPRPIPFPSGRKFPSGASARPMPQADGGDGTGGKMDEQSAGYMELEGAQKDADCDLVQVEGGVSSELGCCNEFDPQQGAKEFECGTCSHVIGGANENTEAAEPTGQAPGAGSQGNSSGFGG